VVTGNPYSSGAGESTAAKAEQKTREAVDAVQEKAGEVVDQAREQTTSQLGTQKDRAADVATQVASALRHTAGELRKNDQPTVGQYADKAADQVERFGGYLQGREVGEIVDEVESFARRHPTAFIGGAVVLGFFTARFFRSSAQPSSSPYQGYRGYQGGMSTAGMHSYGGQTSMPSYGQPAGQHGYTPPTASPRTTPFTHTPSRTGAPMTEVEESGLTSRGSGHDTSGEHEHEHDEVSTRSSTGGAPLADRTVTEPSSTRPSTSDRPGASRFDMPDKE
jgi:hypothetical protein